MNKIIDGHVHLYPEKLSRAVLNWFEKNEGWTMPYKWSADKHIEFLHNIGVEQFIVLSYAHKAGISTELNQWLSDLALKYPEVNPYACVHQDDINKEDMLKQFLDKQNFLGVKIHCFVQQVSALDDRFSGVVKLLAEREKGLVLHASSMPVKTPYITPEQLETLLEQYPTLKVMVAHLGLPEYHNDYLRLLDKHNNLFLDTAYIFGNKRLPAFLGNFKYANDFLKESLTNYYEKIVYGSDFPVMDYSPEDAVAEIQSYKLGESKERHIFYLNAQKFMGQEGKIINS